MLLSLVLVSLVLVPLVLVSLVLVSLVLVSLVLAAIPTPHGPQASVASFSLRERCFSQALARGQGKYERTR